MLREPDRGLEQRASLLRGCPTLLADVRRLIVEGELEGVSSFNQAQVADERLKADCWPRRPALERHLFHLEDHRFSADAWRLSSSTRRCSSVGRERSTKLFADPALLPALTGALLATGDYSRASTPLSLQLDSGTNSRRGGSSSLAPAALTSPARGVLGRLLDAVAERMAMCGRRSSAFTNGWLGEPRRGRRLGLALVLRKYPEMREGRSGIYACAGGALGYTVCMLDKSR